MRSSRTRPFLCIPLGLYRGAGLLAIVGTLGCSSIVDSFSGRKEACEIISIGKPGTGTVVRLIDTGTTINGAGGHGPCEYGLVPGVIITVVQGPVVLQAVSAADGSYTFPVGAGLVGPNHCVISTNAPMGFVPAVPFDFYLSPGLNGPLLLQVIGPDRGP